jgi:hypothetical protein
VAKYKGKKPVSETSQESLSDFLPVIVDALGSKNAPVLTKSCLQAIRKLQPKPLEGDDGSGGSSQGESEPESEPECESGSEPEYESPSEPEPESESSCEEEQGSLTQVSPGKRKRKM